jgi:hypothetical protein
LRTIITFAIVIAVLNASIRGGSAYWKYYQFKDAAHEIALFGGRTDTNTLHSQVLEKAQKLEVPIDWDGIAVERDGKRTSIDAYYMETVEFLPRFSRDLTFKFSVESVLAEPVVPADIMPQ